MNSPADVTTPMIADINLVDIRRITPIMGMSGPQVSPVPAAMNIKGVLSTNAIINTPIVTRLSRPPNRRLRLKPIAIIMVTTLMLTQARKSHRLVCVHIRLRPG